MLASDDKYRCIPVIMLTGRSDRETVCRCHALCAYYVPKCTDIWDRLEPLIRELLFAPEAAMEEEAAVDETAIGLPSAQAQVEPSRQGDESEELEPELVTAAELVEEAEWEERPIEQPVIDAAPSLVDEPDVSSADEAHATVEQDQIAVLDQFWTSIGAEPSEQRTQNETKKEPAMATNDDPQPEKTVLIADDDGDLVQMLVLRCTQLGLRVFRSPDAMHALLGVHRVHPDLVILDVSSRRRLPIRVPRQPVVRFDRRGPRSSASTTIPRFPKFSNCDWSRSASTS